MLAGLLESAVAGAVEGERRVALAFSGGLDSSVVAVCAMKKAEVVAYSGFVPGALDARRAEDCARALGVEFRGVIIDEAKVVREKRTLRLPFDASPMDVSLWCLYSAVSREAKKGGVRVILLGQLADELFGGYAKYEKSFSEGGEAAAVAMMEKDVVGFEEKGRARDAAACGQFVEARFPFAAREVVEFAETIPLSYKIRDGVRKAVLRKAATVLGVPQALAEAPKKAAQYSSGVQKLLSTSGF